MDLPAVESVGRMKWALADERRDHRDVHLAKGLPDRTIDR
jgi:hypothetical protein